jgi:serine phosphatase RsbU (regulator of sigma subunit)
MLLADICGFGSLYAEIAAELRDLMKRNVNSIQQAHAVRCLSSRLAEASQRGGFASTMISTYFAPTRSFTICNAGHPPPLLLRAQAREWSILKQLPTDAAAGDNTLGVVDPIEYQQFNMKLEVGDMVLSYSNALTECRSATGGTVGLDGLLSRVRQLDPSRPSDLTAQLVTQLQHEHVDNLAMSDSTVLLCRASDKSARWQDNVLAPFRLLRAVSDRTRIG